jgi:hypothetical protein
LNRLEPEEIGNLWNLKIEKSLKNPKLPEKSMN